MTQRMLGFVLTQEQLTARAKSPLRQLCQSRHPLIFSMGLGGWEGEEQQGGKQEAPTLCSHYSHPKTFQF